MGDNMGDNVVKRQYLLICIRHITKRYKTKTQYLNVNLDCFLIMNIRYLTFAVKLITYWIFETFNIQNLTFTYFLNKHMMPFALMKLMLGIVKRQYLLTCI